MYIYIYIKEFCETQHTEAFYADRCSCHIILALNDQRALSPKLCRSQRALKKLLTSDWYLTVPIKRDLMPLYSTADS